METPSRFSEIEKMYLIDRLKRGNIWYLWTIEDGQWEVLKTGDWKQVTTKLQELEEKDHVTTEA